ncbi:MAG: TspO/MBR family protein [Terricaulis sp.]
MTDAAHTKAARPTLGALAVFIALVVLGGTAIGFLSLPGEWYAALEKPAFNPPNWIFAPVWTTLYVLIGIAGARTWSLGRTTAGMTLWWVQLALNWIWSPIFFVLHAPLVALAVVASMLIAIIAFIATSWRRDRISAMLFLPYAAWVSFASLLNAGIVVLN